MWTDNEDCDDGNLDDSDMCTILCAAPACDDTIVSGDESDVDCGGSCTPCDLALACLSHSDCASMLCVNDVCALARSCGELNDLVPDLPSGVYQVDPDGEGGSNPFDVYCDMETDGGGWTLVMQNNASVTPGPNPTYDDGVNAINKTGMFGEDLSQFDLFLGLKHWIYLGEDLRIEVGTAPGELTKQAIYPVTLDVNDDYAIYLLAGTVTIGSGEPGLKTYHANTGWGLTTSDNDDDVHAQNCATFYNYAWWYGSCWSGSLWGSQTGNYQNRPYWTGSSNDHHNYGAIWLR